MKVECRALEIVRKLKQLGCKNAGVIENDGTGKDFDIHCLFFSGAGDYPLCAGYENSEFGLMACPNNVKLDSIKTTFA